MCLASSFWLSDLGLKIGDAGAGRGRPRAGVAGRGLVRVDAVEDVPVVLVLAGECAEVLDPQPVEVLVLQHGEGALAYAVVAGALGPGTDVQQPVRRSDGYEIGNVWGARQQHLSRRMAGGLCTMRRGG